MILIFAFGEKKEYTIVFQVNIFRSRKAVSYIALW